MHMRTPSAPSAEHDQSREGAVRYTVALLFRYSTFFVYEKFKLMTTTALSVPVDRLALREPLHQSVSFLEDNVLCLGEVYMRINSILSKASSR